jgi:type II secretory pathway pseudopilin PulG
MTSQTRGAALLEALVALALLGTVASAAAWRATEYIRAVERTHAREADQRAGARLLSAVALWPRADLDRHLGTSRQGPWRMYIERPTRTVYTILLSDTAGGASPLLQTAVYREDTDP